MDTVIAEGVIAAVLPNLGGAGIVIAVVIACALALKRYVDARDIQVEGLLKDHDAKNDRDFAARRAWEEKAEKKIDSLAADVHEIKGILRERERRD